MTILFRDDYKYEIQNMVLIVSKYILEEYSYIQIGRYAIGMDLARELRRVVRELQNCPPA